MLRQALAQKPNLRNPHESISITGSGSTGASGYYDNDKIMRIYSQTNVQMFQIILSGQSIKNDSSNQYLDMATKTLVLERQLANASNQFVSPTWHLGYYRLS
jgi:hypothetical protein